MKTNGAYLQSPLLERSTLSRKYKPFVRKTIATLPVKLLNAKDFVDTSIFVAVQTVAQHASTFIKFIRWIIGTKCLTRYLELLFMFVFCL